MHLDYGRFEYQDCMGCSVRKFGQKHILKSISIKFEEEEEEG